MSTFTLLGTSTHHSHNGDKNVTEDSGRSNEMALNGLETNQEQHDAVIPTTFNVSVVTPTIHETDDWRNAAGEDEGNESNIHAAFLWKQHHNTSKSRNCVSLVMQRITTSKNSA